ncbi:MAG: SulP family inorganic anion transporter [Elusimicrobia bacterium]|nr:SulP family inorganic anion transporter [Elusimicrobiota bacterium]
MSETKSGLIGDLWGGFAATLVAIPSALAFGVATFAALGPDFAGRGALAGLIAAAVAGLVASPLGGAPRLVTVPCAPAAAVMGALAADLAGAGAAPERVIVTLALVALACGALQFFYGATGAGRIIKYIPFPVVSGYLSGVGLIIFLKQLPALCGVPDVQGLYGVLTGVWRPEALIVGAAAVAGMFGGPKLTKAAPAAVLGLLAGAAAYVGLAFFDRRMASLVANPLVIGPLPSLAGCGPALLARWRAAAQLRPADLKALASPALTLSILLSIDTLKTCLVTDVLTRSRHDSNKELRAQGLANIASTLTGGVPVSGALGATLVNINSGARTRLSGVLAAVFVLATLLLCGGLVAWTPLAALAGILIVVAVKMVDWRAVRLLRHRSTLLDFGVILTVAAAAVGIDLITAAGLGVALAILLFIRDQIHGSVIRRKQYGNEFFSRKHRLPDQRKALERLGDIHLICQLQGNLFFGTTDQLFMELEPDLGRCRVVILDLRRVQGMDLSAAHMLEQIGAMLAEKGGTLAFAHIPASLPTGPDLAGFLADVGLSRDARGIRIFETVGEALEWAEDCLLAEQGLLARAEEAPLALGDIDLLRGLDARLLEALESCAHKRSFAEGQQIFHRDDDGDELFLIRQGEVRVELELKSGKRHHLAGFSRGDYFGEVVFLDPGRHTADAVAATATELFALPRRRIDQAFAADPALRAELFARLAKAIALRLRGADKDLRRLQDA